MKGKEAAQKEEGLSRIKAGERTHLIGQPVLWPDLLRKEHLLSDLIYTTHACLHLPCLELIRMENKTSRK